MALVDDDEIEEIGSVLVQPILVPLHQGLVGREVHLAIEIGSTADTEEWLATESLGEVLAHRICHKRITIREVQDPVIALRVGDPVVLTQEMHDLHRGEGLAGTRGHEQEDSPLATSHCAQHAPDRDRLVPPRLLDVTGGQPLFTVEPLGVQCLPRRVEIMQVGVSRPCLGWPGKGLDSALATRHEIALDDLVAIGGVGERDVKLLCVTQCLLQTVGRRSVGTLRLDHSDRHLVDLEDVVDEAITEVARTTPEPQSPARLDWVLLADVCSCPTRGRERGHDDIPAGLALQGTTRHGANLRTESRFSTRRTPQDCAPVVDGQPAPISTPA